MIGLLVSFLTSHLSPLTSHLSPLTSHLSPLTSHLSDHFPAGRSQPPGGHQCPGCQVSRPLLRLSALSASPAILSTIPWLPGLSWLPWLPGLSWLSWLPRLQLFPLLLSSLHSSDNDGLRSCSSYCPCYSP